MKKILIGVMALGLVSVANAGYWDDSQSSVVRSGYGLCWVNSQGTYDEPDKRLLDCNDATLHEFQNKHVLRVPSADVPGGAINFDFDSSELDERAVETINAIRDAVPADADVEVVGHTDAVGTFEYNLMLGARRSATVRNELNLEGKTFSVGETEPVVDTLERNRENRRVEVTAKWKTTREEVERHDRPAQ